MLKWHCGKAKERDEVSWGEFMWVVITGQYN